jgi:hypothetical protein
MGGTDRMVQYPTSSERLCEYAYPSPLRSSRCLPARACSRRGSPRPWWRASGTTGTTRAVFEVFGTGPMVFPDVLKDALRKTYEGDEQRGYDYQHTYVPHG